MRYIILHKTNAHYEAGGGPTPELVKEVGTLIGDWMRQGVFLDGDGLRPTSEGARVSASGQATPGPLVGAGKAPAGFVVFRAPSLDAAVEQSRKIVAATGAVEVDVRPANEAWDIGLAPKPEGVITRRYLAHYKGEDTRSVQPVVEQLERDNREPKAIRFRRPLSGKRLRKPELNAKGKTSVLDGPFAESKELIGGFSIVNAASLDQAVEWARRYIDVVDTTEVDVLALEDQG